MACIGINIFFIAEFKKLIAVLLLNKLATESITISAKVWSPRAGLKLLMKFEDAAPWPATKATAEITATTTVANAWELLTFTITGVDASLEYYNLVLIMDNGTQGDGSSNYTIYVDDIAKY